MIRIAIVEDEENYCKQLMEFIKKYDLEQRMQSEVIIYKDGESIVREYHGQYQLIFMDIQMNGMNGMQAAKKIREKDKDVIFVFVTTTVAYAVQGYAVDAMGYILKPVSYVAFAQIMAKAINSIRKHDKHYLSFTSEQGMFRINLDSIYYIESMRHKVIIHTNEKDHYTPGTMKVLEEELSDKGFARCNNAYLVNLRYVDGILQNNVNIAGNMLSISRTKRKDFMNALTDYIGGGIYK
jgi:DNA-binding LytR/AlgR family response regulator